MEISREKGNDSTQCRIAWRVKGETEQGVMGWTDLKNEESKKAFIKKCESLLTQMQCWLEYS